MKLDEINVGMVTRALDIYHRVAYAGQSVFKSPDFGHNPSLQISIYLDRFVDETTSTESSTIRRYILRMGNSLYPFMKFVIQEQLVQNEYFFSVDTHDDMFKVAAVEDRDLARVREFNRKVKEQIEELWLQEGFPTSASLDVLIQEKRLLKHRKPRNRTILVVDDDRDIGRTVMLLLEAQGYTVERLFDGADAVDVADAKRHDLIIMDYEMKVMDGLEACLRLKADQERCHIPIIIATTRNLDISRLEYADAFLKKPFYVDTLMSFIHHHLGADSI